jgi:DNA-directed RNA polymerase subunit RPC12/RpoP
VREKFMRFMQGRYGSYGADSLNRFLLAGALVAMIVSLFTRWNVLYGIALAALIYSYFRMLSRNYTRRYAENQVFLKYTMGIRRFFTKQKNVMSQRKTHHIYKCPGCKQKIRVPKGKGKIAVRCPKCGMEFIKKS